MIPNTINTSFWININKKTLKIPIYKRHLHYNITRYSYWTETNKYSFNNAPTIKRHAEKSYFEITRMDKKLRWHTSGIKMKSCTNNPNDVMNIWYNLLYLTNPCTKNIKNKNNENEYNDNEQLFNYCKSCNLI